MKSDAEIEVRERFTALAPHLDERGRRLLAATEAQALGDGGVQVVHNATGMSIRVIRAGLVDLNAKPLPRGQVRKAGGGRKRLVDTDPTLWEDLERLVSPATRGDPTSPLLWSSKSLRQLAAELEVLGHAVSHDTIGRLLREHGYNLQVNQKTLEGTSHEDRDAQFNKIQSTVDRFQAEGQPVISVDTKKKELVGPFKNGGREWLPAGEPEEVNVHDFPSDSTAKAVPYGVYDVGRNEAFVTVGINHDTAEFAVNSILRWWNEMGRAAYPEATDLLITADSGGSNGSRLRLCKIQLQRLANETGLGISVCHLPPGTSKWNKIEHRLFCHITRNWRGRPLVSLEAVVNLIANARTDKGLHVNAALDEAAYEKGIQVSDAELAAVQLERDAFHGEWNYTIFPT